jgi:hypothetical protein
VIEVKQMTILSYRHYIVLYSWNVLKIRFYVNKSYQYEVIIWITQHLVMCEDWSESYFDILFFIVPVQAIEVTCHVYNVCVGFRICLFFYDFTLRLRNSSDNSICCFSYYNFILVRFINIKTNFQNISRR